MAAGAAARAVATWTVAASRSSRLPQPSGRPDRPAPDAELALQARRNVQGKLVTSRSHRRRPPVARRGQRPHADRRRPL